jgi:hypothetical protein
MIDPRIVKLGIEVDGNMKVYDGLNIVASGIKFANANQNECSVKISNIVKETRNEILTRASPFRNKTAQRQRLFLYAGRESYGEFLLYSGDIISAIPTQPPDIDLTLKSLTANKEKSSIVSTSIAGSSSLEGICKTISSILQYPLVFQATDKMINNFSFSGSSLGLVYKLNQVGGVNAFIDDHKLMVKDALNYLTGKMRVLSKDTGMVGLPEMTEQGVKVRYLLDNTSVIGGGLKIESDINPAATGDWVIYKLGFDIASRDTPFYYIAEARPI